jgi:hypothetical protein
LAGIFCAPHIDEREGGQSKMPTNREFSMNLEDQPGTLAKVCRALADRGVNIVALQATPKEGKSLIRFVVDNPKTAKTVLDSEHLACTETQVVQVRLANRPGELARAAARLGEAKININHLYCGLESNTNAPVLIFGVTDVGRASTILEETGAGAAGA